MSRILMVTPYAPYRDGIAAYAVQQVKALRAEGNDVEVLSPAPSAAHQWLDLRNRRGPIALARRVSGFDRLVIQFHPDVFFPVGMSRNDHAMSTAGLLVACRLAHESEVVVHEFDDEPLRYGRRNRALTARMWRTVDRLVFHTAIERDRFVAVWPVRPERTAVVAHGATFVPHTNADRAAARAVLGLPPDRFVFVAIGFIQPHKGFDRAVAAFSASGAASVGAQLHVVGSVRVDEPAFLQHRDDLAAAIRQTKGATLHDAYLSDEAFDLWLVAADAVVLPYRQIWSSGVMERAALFSRLVIATRVGGLGEQAPPGTVLVDDDATLTAAMAAAAGVVDSPKWTRAVEPWPDGDRDTIQAEVRRRAHRPTSSRD
ncbi:MAG TPA: glycosyltransferase family 4 protein [Acidimicrobiales bacterium]|nr:glycosyltransferase family 4 protein [Acidimicrobiales bacterium]